jgi:SH3-like domain-containing protein
MMKRAILSIFIGAWAFVGMGQPTIHGFGNAAWAQDVIDEEAEEETGAEAEDPSKPTSRDPKRGPVTNLPLPRFLSLKGSEGNARRGPSLSHRIDWVFKHVGMPLRVTAEYGNWRRVEDRDGAGGWVHYSLLSGVRTAIVQDDMVELKSRPDLAAGATALAQMGAIVRLGKCTLDWCEISSGREDGWVLKDAIWGVEADELRD